MERIYFNSDAYYWGFKRVNDEALWLADRSSRSSVLFGPPGQGKATDILIPNLLLGGPGRGLYVNDSKAELYAICARQMRKLGYKTYLINPFNILRDWPHEDMTTCRFNPLENMPGPDDPEFINTINALAEGLILRDGGNTFFTDGARNFVAGVIAFVCGAVPPDLRNFTSVLRIVKARGEEFQDFMRDMQASNIELAQMAAAPYLVAEPTRGAMEILETASVQLSFLAVPGIQHVLNGPSDFTWSDLKRGNVAVFIALPEAEGKMYARFTRMLLASAFKSCLTFPRAPVSFVLDELANSLGGEAMSLIPIGFALGRGYGVYICPAVFQSYPQAVSVFGKNDVENFLACSATQCWLTPNDPISCDVIAKRGGERLGLDVQFNPMTQAWTPTGRGAGIPIFRAHDLYGFPRNKLILYRENCAQAITAYRLPYFKIPMLAAVANVSPYAPLVAKKAGMR